jgi:GTP-binding protein
MSGEFVHTVGNISQIEELFTGEFLKGRREPRIAMVGRSNVGKSSLINALLEGSFAQVSKQPGKTRCIHFYSWKEPKLIVADLPGYGFAKTSHEERERWAGFINAYIEADPVLQRALVLLDARHGPTELDREAIQFLKSEGIPVTFVMTKADQLKTQSERASRKKEVERAILEMGFSAEFVFWVSARTKDGLHKLTDELSLISQKASQKSQK